MLPDSAFEPAYAFVEESAMTTTTKAQRRLAHEQALASTRIEGHLPSAEFLADCEAVIEGSMTTEQARAASLARALASDPRTYEAQATPDSE